LTPESATNPVDADHLLTATVADEFGNLVEGADVHFAVAGDGTPAPDSGDAVTDAAGQATFTFTNDEEGDNTITACADTDGDQTCDAGEVSDTATKTWEVPVPTTVELSPADDSNRVGTSHLVTAHVEDQFGSPWPGVTVRFSVTGVNPTSGSGATNASGDATFSYMGASAGDDLIAAFADVDGDTTEDPGEPADTAEKTWTRACPGFATDPRNQVVGTAGADVLNGTGGADIICGLGANDVLNGRGGNDLVLGGAGADVGRGGAGRDTVQGASGRDRLFGGGADDLLLGGAGPDRLDGGPGDDRCIGGPGRDRTIRC
jgi:Ca2+-binding RTX toxin-like protein